MDIFPAPPETIPQPLIHQQMSAETPLGPAGLLTAVDEVLVTREALENIARTTMENVTAFEKGEPSGNEVAAA